MKRINDLVFTSVQDTKSTLECTLIHDPKQALEDAEAVLKAMAAFGYNQPSRRKMLNSIINKANKALKAQWEWNDARFEREPRYAVMKLSDANAALSNSERKQLDELMMKVAQFRLEQGKEPLECVVVEADWPIYEATWDALEQMATVSNCSRGGGASYGRPLTCWLW